jgi:hypothetical protein
MFQVSPGINVSEYDLTGGVPAVATSEAALAGVMRWGPVNQRVRVSSEPNLIARFGKPTNYNAKTWFVAASFLAYSDSLIVTRVSDGTAGIAVFTGSTANSELNTVLNSDDYDTKTFSANVGYVAKYPGELGNSLRISQCDSAAAYNTSINLVANADIALTSNLAVTVGATSALVSIGFTGNGVQATANAQAYSVNGKLQAGDKILVGNSTIGTQYLKIATVGAVTGNSTISKFTLTLAEPYRLRSNYSSNTVNRFWEFENLVDGAPATSDYVTNFGNTAATDQVHVVVVDEGGKFSGVPGTVLEVYDSLSRATDAKKENGQTNYYKNVLNDTSKYVWFATDRTGAAAATADAITSASTTTPLSVRFTGGTDGSNEDAIALGDVLQGYDTFKAGVDPAFILAGAGDSTTINYLVDNLSESRKDCLTFGSAPLSAVLNNVGQEADAVAEWAGTLRASSYLVADSGWKQMYDKYNDTFRWIPLNGDVAGLCARTDFTNDPWWSPAGAARGQIKNVVKLAWNPVTLQERNTIYKAYVNPVFNEGEGTMLFGDRTRLGTSSAFSSINVRRLFIFVEKAIASDAKRMLFEFNDPFTQAQFRNRTIPFLRDVQGRRGVIAYKVVCDGTNNTSQIVDSGQFVGDIYIKPNRSINTIQLNFVAVGSGVEFNEIVGQF